MLLRRISATKYRKFSAPISVGRFSEGLTIIVGANEAGKSTLVQCLRTVLFESYKMKGPALESIRPYNDYATPQVKVEFELDGHSYTLLKIWGEKEKSAFLKSSHGEWKNEQAEEWLRKELSFKERTSHFKGNKEDDMVGYHKQIGILGALWGKQGETFKRIEFSDQAQQDLHNLLQQEISNIVMSDTDHTIIKKIEERYRMFYTETKGDRKKKYDEKRKQLEQKEQEIEKLEQQQREYEDVKRKKSQVEKDLWRCTDELQTLEENKKEAVKKVEKARQSERDQERLQAVQDQVKVRKSGYHARQKLIQEVKTAKEEVQTTKIKAHSAQKTLEKGLIQERHECNAQKETLQKKREQAINALHKIHELQSKKEGLLVTSEIWENVKKYQYKYEKAEEIFKAVGTKIYIDTSEELEVSLDGERVSPEERGEHLLTKKTILTLGAYGQITIIPGGKEEEIEEYKRRYESTEQRLDEAFHSVGVKTYEEAQAAFLRFQANEKEIEKYTEQFKENAPNGLEGLEGTSKNIEARLQKIESWLKEYGGESKECSEEDLQEMKKIDQVKEDVLVWSIDYRTYKEKLRTYEEKSVELERVQKEESDDSLLQKVSMAEEELEKLQGSLTLSEDMSLAEAEQNLRTIETEYKNLESEKTKKNDDNRIYEGQIKQLERQNLKGQLENLQKDYDLMKAEIEKETREGEGIKFLYELVSEVEKESQQGKSEPIQKEVQPYLKMLFPESETLLGIEEERMSATELKRWQQGGEKFEDLSMGTREQVGVIVRLAYAHFLARRGMKRPVILDDPFVNSDKIRLQTMFHILQQASKEIQILLLTCHSENYERLGGKILKLSESQVAGDIFVRD